MHTHGDSPDRSDSHGGSRAGLGWELLDSIVAACAVVIMTILAELLYKSWRDHLAGVRYDLTPEGVAAAAARTAAPDPLPEPHPNSGVRVDTDQLNDEK